MADNTIALNLRRIRRAANISQVDLAGRSGISRAAYQNIENGRSEPRIGNLQAIARALDVSIQQLVEPARELRAVRFRSNKSLRSREQVLADVGQWLGNFGDLETVLGDRVEYRLEGIAKKLAPGENRGRAAASLARAALGLDREEPIRDICGLLESGGIKVGAKKIASHAFFGLSVAAAEGGPAVFVNTWERISVERWIFTAAHELGHLILHLADYDVGSTEEKEEHEAEANEFAAFFLMPEASFRKEWEETYGLAFIDRVMKVKRIFRVSYRTVLHRLAGEFSGPGNIWSRFQTDYVRRYGRSLLREDEPDALEKDAFRASFPEPERSGEPDTLSPADFLQDRLCRLVRRAVEQEKISLARGAEILGIPLQAIRDLSCSWVG
jgi:Zn-dependent peptidase ImmA (M78 family)/transcriptional regulator with XRE-family HTH domain